MKSTAIVAKLLANTTDLDVVRSLVAEDATYVSLNYNNPDLTAIEPWCGMHAHAGPEAIHKTFVDVGTYWAIEKFDIYAIFGGSSAEKVDTGTPTDWVGCNATGADVAVFGRFRYRAHTTGRATDSPFCIWAKVDEEKQKVTYMQFMEDTLDTAKSFYKSGRMTYASNPEGGEVTIGDENDMEV